MKLVCKNCETELKILNGVIINGIPLSTELNYCPECGIVQEGCFIKYDPKKEVIEFLKELKNIFKKSEEEEILDFAKKDKVKVLTLFRKKFGEMKDCTNESEDLEGYASNTVYFRYVVSEEFYNSYVRLESFNNKAENIYYKDKNDNCMEITYNNIDNVIKDIEK